METDFIKSDRNIKKQIPKLNQQNANINLLFQSSRNDRAVQNDSTWF